MAIRTTKWRPDTCECELEYQWDDSLAEAQRTHTCSRIINAGPEHSGLIGNLALFLSTITEESQRKNKAVALAVARGESNPQWSFSGLLGDLRILQLNTPGLSALTKASLQTDCNTQLGVGRVVVS